MRSTVDTTHPVIPLALLEALQNLDAPPGDDLREIADELIARRFGLSDTVAAQAERYARHVRSGAAIEADEAVLLFTVLGRRPDHELLFSDAGRRAARRAVRLLYPRSRVLARLPPDGLGRRLGWRMAARAASRVFGGSVTVEGSTPAAVIPEPLSVRGAGDGRGCAFYSAAFAELLRLLVGYEGAMHHTECRARGAEACRWRAVLPSELTQ